MTNDFEVTEVGAVDAAYERGRRDMAREAAEQCHLAMDKAKSHGAYPQVLGAKWCRDAILAPIPDAQEDK